MTRNIQAKVLLLVSISLFGIPANTDAFRFIKDWRIKFEKIVDSAMANTLGTEDAPQEFRAFVGDIAREMGCETNAISVKVLRVPAKNAFAVCNTLWVDYAWLTAMAPEVQRAIIAHEIAHIRCKHINKSIALFFILAIASGVMQKKLELDLQKDPDTSLKGILAGMGKAMGGALVIQGVPTIFFLWYKRMQEKEADLLSAHTCQCHKDLVAFCLEHHEEVKANMEQLGFGNIDNPIGFKQNLMIALRDLFSTHPNAKKRIAYLEQDLVRINTQ